jgi:dTDP-4-dehydrorhamnose 3,5-epimerase-like enzyme
MKMDVKLIKIQNVVDDRGLLTFSNDLSLELFKRFYMVENHTINFIRAWHGHLLESKVFIPLEGTFRIGVCQPDDWNNPNKDQNPKTFILSSLDRQALFVPPGNYNGLQNLTAKNKLLVFSDKLLKESIADDYRLKFDFWNPWETSFR